MPRIRAGQPNDGLAIDAPPHSIQVVEAVVLLVDDHQVLVRAQRPRLGCCRDRTRDSQHSQEHKRDGKLTTQQSRPTVTSQGKQGMNPPSLWPVTASGHCAGGRGSGVDYEPASCAAWSSSDWPSWISCSWCP